MQEKEFENPIDKNLVAVNPGSLPYAHHIGSAVIKPDDVGLAMKAMYQQTDVQLRQIKDQIDLLITQSKTLPSRIQISEQIYQAAAGFDPVIMKRLIGQGLKGEGLNIIESRRHSSFE